MPLPGFSDPNAQAAANAGRGLSNLGNFLYEQQVQKPAIQAQTAQTTAQTQALQQNTALQGLQIPSAQQAAIFATHPGINVKAANDAVNGVATPQSTDISTQGNAPQLSTTPDVTTGAMGAGSSGSSPGSMSSPVLLNTQPPNQAGSSTQGASSASGLSAPKPGTLAQPKLKPTLAPFDSDELSPVALTRPSAPVATGSNSGATSTPPPTGLAVPPASPPASVTAPVKPFDMREHLGDDLMSPEIPQAARDSILADLRAPFSAAKVPVSDAALVQHYREQQSAYYPTMAQRIGSGGMVPIKATLGGPGGGSAEYINPNAASQLGGGTGGAPEGFIRDPMTMELKPDPTYASATPEKVRSTQEDLNTISQAQKQLDAARAALAAHPMTVGGVSGGIIGNTVRSIASGASNLTGGAIGETGPKAAESTLEQFKSGKFIDSLDGMHVGRMDLPIVEGLKASIPAKTDPPERWAAYLNQAQDIINQRKAAVAQEYGKQTKERQALPNVNLSPPVGALGATPGQAAPAQNNIASGLYPTAESRAHLPSGTKFQVAPGQWRQKN